MENTTTVKTAAVIGAGPAGLMAAEQLARAGLRVTIYERMPSPARKLLMAGRGGLNITHSEAPAAFLSRYGKSAARLAPLLAAFGAAEVRAFCTELGQETFVGSSGKVFPRAFKASPLLRAWLRHLAELDVQVRLRWRFGGFDGRFDGRFDGPCALFDTPEGPQRIEADVVVLALGGASWPRLGADGGWVAPLEAAGVAVSPLRPANCGMIVDWSAHFIEKFEGQPLKNIALRFDETVARGELMVTRRGLEGGAVYALSGAIREALAVGSEAQIEVDLRPDLGIDDLTRRLSRPRGKASFANFLRKAVGLGPLAIALLREDGPPPTEPAALAAAIKAAPLLVQKVSGLERAISTAGGVAWDALDENLMLRAHPGVFVAGEMLDWEAPTGGYLLTACLATGRAAGLGAAQWALAGADDLAE